MSGEASLERSRVVGIQLSKESLVPVVILKAAGEQADQLIDKAKASEVPVVKSRELSSQLYRIPVDNTVTPDLFPLMAALLAHVIYLDRGNVTGGKRNG